MKRIMVRYKVKADKVSENEAFISQVFEELHSGQPDGIRYASFKLPDGQSFVHIVSIETDDASNPLAELSSFKAFIEQIKDRCEEPPMPSELTEVGTYDFFGQ